MKQRSALVFTWAWWIAIGLLMISKGIKMSPPEELRQGVIFGFILGFLVHLFILQKNNRKLIGHIHSLPTPIKLKSLYPKSIFINLFAVYLAGVFVNFLPISVRNLVVINFAIGTSILSGGSDFLSSALFPKKRVFKP